MKKHNLILLTLIFTILQACAQQQTYDDYTTSFEKEFKDELYTNNVSHAVYAVFTNDSIIFQGAFSKNGTKVDGNSPFLIGSITKVFTAVAVMQLYEQGKIDIDKPVSDYVPDFTINQRFPDSEAITVRAVLTHHAGIPSDCYLHKFSRNQHDLNEILHYLNSQYTCYPVGKIWAYSNLGYALMGILIERASGLKYEDYIAQHIFNPLGMINSGFYSDFEKQKELAIAYSSGERIYEYPLLDKPAGAIYSTVNDMVLFCRAFIDKKEHMLKNATLAKMYELQNRDNLLDMDHRMAICFNYKNKAYELGRILEHGGATMYHRAQMVIAPDAGLAGIMLSDSPTGKDNAWKLDEQVMVEYCKTKEIVPDKALNPEKIMQFTPISSKNLEHYAGNYAMPGMVCKFDWKNGYLSPTINGQNFYLAPNDSNSFVPAKRFMGMMFKSKKMFFLLEEINSERHFIQAMPWGGLSIIGTQTSPKCIPEIWESRTGSYTIVNEDNEDAPSLKNIKIAIESSFVILKYDFNPDMSFGQNASLALDIADDKVSFVLGYGRGGGESVVFDENGEIFQYMGLRFIKQ
jgi:CubicO group peptidase (beta-lactamase class C family)